jgi:CHRD domain-containing protein
MFSKSKTKPKKDVTLLLVVMVAVFSIGITTIQLKSAYAQDEKFSASLSGSQEVPPNTSTAKGWAWFKSMGDAVGYKLNVTGIDKVTMAHIHDGKPGQNGDPIAMLQIVKSSGPTNGTLAQGNITASDLMGSLAGKSVSDLVTKIKSKETYVNVHTEANPNGEIRGQILSGANNVSSETSAAGNDSSESREPVNTIVNDTGKFLANIPGETNELLRGESESTENDTVGN